MSSATRSDWSFNLRARTNHDSDSDSDNEPTTNSISEEARLLQELDLSNREETVVYKPNPFSIAKINAASRPQNRSAAPAVDRRPAKAVSKKPTGRIVDSFKKAEKKSLNSSVTQPKFKGKPSRANANPPPKPNKSPAAHSPIRTHAPLPIPTESLPIIIPQIPDAEPVTTATLASPSTTVPRSSPKRFVVKKLRRPVNYFSSPLKESSLALRDPTIPAPQTQTFFSSPLRPTQFASSASHALAQPKYSGGNLTQRSKLPTNPAFHQPHHTYIPEPKLTPHALTPTISPQLPRMITPSSSILRPQALRAPELVAQQQSHDSRPTILHQEIASNQFEPTVLLASPSHRPQSRDVCRQHDLNLLHQLPPSSPIRSPIPTPSPSPRRKREAARKLLPPKKSLKRQASDAYDYFRSDPDDEWSTLPARKKVKAPEQAKVKISGVRTTAAFRLPGTVTKGRVTGLSATSERRVVSFLPPPLKTGKAEVVVGSAGARSEEGLVGNKALPRALKHSHESSPPVGTPKRRRLDNPYPSPANSRLTPSEATVVAQSDVAPSNIQSSSPIRPSQHRFPSPPTSDDRDPVPEHDPEVHTTVAVDAVSERYPRTKSVMRQRRHETEVAWNLLELPSCGNVHSGVTVDEAESLGELPVVVWEGRPQVPV